ncbi:MAG: hypothetical protein UGF45_01595, partial [Massilioclostridium sp.]|nr:hypothetical protein [Massilioclostridium sp.]
ITGGLRPPWAIKAQFSTRPNWASNALVFFGVYFFLTDALGWGFILSAIQHRFAAKAPSPTTWEGKQICHSPSFCKKTP